MEEQKYINIREYNGGIFSIQYNPKKPIKDLKERIKKQYAIPEYCQQLYFNNNELSDNKYLSDYNINSPNDFVDFRNLHNLRTNIKLKYIKLIYYLKASDSILDLKKKIFEKENIPIKNMQILKSGNIIDDNKLIEDYISDLNFEIKLIEIEKIKININYDRNIDAIYIDPFSNISDIEKQIKKNFEYRLKYKDKFLNSSKLLIQYHIKNNDDIELIKSKGAINLVIKFLDDEKLNIKVYLEQKIYELQEYLLNIKGNDYQLKYMGQILNYYKSFSDYDIEDYDVIIASGRSIGGSSKIKLL